MKLNYFEFLLMNNPLRELIQKNYEFPALLRMISSRRLDHVLEVGCGNGNATQLIQRHFHPRRIIAVDLDQRMVRIAKKNNKSDNISFQVMDASMLSFADHSFDAVFEFGIIHHVPNWRDCLGELKRVLKPGGELIMEDLSIDSFSGFPGRAYRPLMIHPYGHMYSVDEFVTYAVACGFDITQLHRINPLGLIKMFRLAARA